MGGMSRVVVVVVVLGGVGDGVGVVFEDEGVGWVVDDVEALFVWSGADAGAGSVLLGGVVSGEAVFSSSSSVVSLALGVDDVMPKRVLISSSRRPLDCKNVTLRSVGASRMDSSSRNLAACSMRADREVSSEVGDEVDSELSVLRLEALLGCCHEGIEDGLGLESAMICMRRCN